MSGIKNLRGMNSFGFPKLGTIRLGMMKKSSKSGKEYPVEADHFVLRDAPDLIPAYGTEPKRLLIYLPYPEQDRNFRTAYELFKRGGLYCQGDGETISWAVDPGKSGQVVIRDGVVRTPYTEETGEMKDIGDRTECPGAQADGGFKRCADCRARGLLFVIVRDPKEPLKFVNNQMGYYRISTGSISNIIEVTQNLNTLAGLAAALGKNGLAGIPMILTRTAETRSITNEEGKRAQVEKHFLSISVDDQWAQYGALAMAAQAIGRPVQELMALPDGRDDGDGDVVDGSVELPSGPLTDPEEVDEELARKIADLQAAKDNVPANWGQFHETLQGFYGSAYDSKAIIMELRQQMGLARTDELPLDAATWSAACDLMIDNLGG